MAVIGDALRQAFMPKREFDNLRDDEKAWSRLQRPLSVLLASCIGCAVVVAVSLSMSIVFPGETGRRVFCHDKRFQALSLRESDVPQYPGAFYLTDDEAAEYYWMVVFIPSVIIFFVSVVYLLAGMAVARSRSSRHWCLKLVENNFCSSKRGGLHCLYVLNVIFALVFGLLGLFLGSSLLTLGSSCSVPLFWCYEVSAQGLALLYGGAALVLRRKAAVAGTGMMWRAELTGRDIGLEMLGPAHELTPEMERQVNEGFKAWIGSSLLSSDEEEDGPECHLSQASLLYETP
ncbi:uncharacterized protein LOC144701145 [Wolffia australiana]